MSEIQRNIWVLSRPACAQVNNAMQMLTGVQHRSSEQIKDLSVCRIERDLKDRQIFKEFLVARNPFSASEDLVNILNGMHAGTDVNVERSKDIGFSILKKMNDKSPGEFTFRKKEQAVTLASKNAVKIKEDSVQIDSNLMFQRLASFAVKTDSSLSETLKYELSSHPPALFDSNGMMKEAKKAQLADGLYALLDDTEFNITDEALYVVDGGALLHKLPWEKHSSFNSIIDKYSKYVINNYGKPIIVFDGYDTSSTKDMTHSRRNKGRNGVEVSFDENMRLNTSKDLFLEQQE